MAMGMLGSYGNSFLDQGLVDDVNAYLGGDAAFAAHVGSNYDSSGDYWKLISRSDGTHRLEAEYDKDGNLIKDLNIVYEDKGKDGQWETIGTDHLSMGNARTGAQSLFQILGGERALDQVALFDPTFAQSIKDLPRDQFEKKVGEFLMDHQGMNYDSKNQRWSGTISSTLTDNLTDGYILFNDLGKGNYDRFTVSATLNRAASSWDGVIGAKGVAATSANKKALDSMTFEKRDLEGMLLDKPYTVKGIQSVDVSNAPSQPWDSKWLNKVIEGNTVTSDFSIKVISEDDGWKIGVLQNAWALDGDWIKSSGYDAQPEGGRWLLHGNTINQTSDGCIIPSNSELLALSNKWTQWGLRPGQEIYSHISDPYGWWIKGWGRK
jgi:hypothetical protein